MRLTTSWLTALMCMAGCASSATEMVALDDSRKLAPEVRVVEVPRLVRVSFKKQSGNIFEFEVINFGDKPILVDRDQVELVLPDGSRQRRLPGGLLDKYTLKTAEVHALNARFDLERLDAGATHTTRGKVYSADIDFSKALLLGGEPIAVQPLHLLVAIKHWDGDR